MEEPDFDIAVSGSTPLALLLAGLLAQRHGKRVALVSAAGSPFRLRRQFDLSMAPVTRPQTLLLMKRLAAETSKLVSELGKGLTDRLDALFIAETPASAAALGHFRHLAQPLGIAAEQHADRGLSEGAICRIRDVEFLSPARLWPALLPWFDNHRVARFERSLTQVTIRRDGTARLTVAGRPYEAAATVLADDDSILSYLPEDGRDRSLVAVPVGAWLAEPAKTAPAFAQFLDRGVTIHNAGRSGVAALVTGDPGTAAARLGASIARERPLQRAGEAHFSALITADGGPIVANARGGKAVLIAGFGLIGASFAPALARHIAGVAAADEAAFIAAHGPTRAGSRTEAAAFAPVPA